MAAGEEFGRGLLPVWLSEWCRQAMLSVILLSALLGMQAGLLLLALAVYLRPQLDEHAAVLGGAALPREQQLLTACGAIVLLTSTLGLGWAAAARVRGKSRRRDALLLGQLYVVLEAAAVVLLITLAILLEVHLLGFQGHYHAGLSRALWSYADSPTLKAYVDRTQARYQCCGSLGYSDWFVIDWYPLSLYVARYLATVQKRDQFAARGKLRGSELRASFAMTHFGGKEHARLVLAAVDDELRSQQLSEDLLDAKLQLGFSEVPFSCCDPASPTWCRQMGVIVPGVRYTPPTNLTIFTTGCSSRVPGFFTWYLYVARCAALAVAAFKLTTVLLCRYCQSSMANALAAGRHLSYAPGWLLPLWPHHRAAGGQERHEVRPLLGASEDEDGEEEDDEDEDGEGEEDEEEDDEDEDGEGEEDEEEDGEDEDGEDEDGEDEDGEDEEGEDEDDEDEDDEDEDDEDENNGKEESEDEKG